MSKPFAATIAMLLVITLVAPAAFFIAPQKTSAQAAVQCFGAGIGAAYGLLTSFIGLSIPVGDSGTQQGTSATAGSTIGTCINEVVLKPLAASLIREILRAITASTINWITGRSNGTGKPSFALNLSVHLQSVGDAVALPFINQVRTGLNSPFGGAISSSLLAKYAQGTSVGGFLAANQSTLAQVSPNVNTFLAGGRWSHSEWFALTTQSNNNPYMLESAAQSQLGNLISQAKTNRRQDLVQGKGFLSWCGASDNSSGPNGINPGASCRNTDGSEGNIQTPGTVIQGYTEQVLGADLAQLINPKDIDASLAAIFGAIVQQGISSILGSTGLFGTSQPSSVRPTAVTSQLYNTATSNSTAITAANTDATAAISRATEYATAWNTIAGAASRAQVSATSLKNNPACTSQSGAADTALGQINSVLAQAQTELADASATQTLARQVQSEATDTTSAGVAKLNTDIQTLATMKPQAADVTYAKAQAVATDGASASPSGSLTVSGGTLVDQMHLIITNASTMSANNCLAP